MIDRRDRIERESPPGTLISGRGIVKTIADDESALFEVRLDDFADKLSPAC